MEAGEGHRSLADWLTSETRVDDLAIAQHQIESEEDALLWLLTCAAMRLIAAGASPTVSELHELDPVSRDVWDSVRFAHHKAEQLRAASIANNPMEMIVQVGGELYGQEFAHAVRTEIWRQQQGGR